MIDFKRDSDNLIVAGNGPSLKNIDLNSLPNDFDVFRCNQFYCEDRYYIGKNIKLVMFNPIVIHHQIRTIHEIIKRNEYKIENICLNYINNNWDTNFCLNKFKSKMPFVYILKDILDKQILKDVCLFDEFDNLRPTSGVLLMLLGKSLGYKNIYFIGMDFALNNNQEQMIYIENSNICNTVYKNNNITNFMDELHNSKYDLSLINKFNFIPLRTTNELLAEKKIDYINDFILERNLSFDKKANYLKTIEKYLRRKIKKKLGFKKYQQF
ncbi:MULTISPECIES: alpha-2,3-sialyltransferase [unclassified Campylobacter]|uniref:alpha-2,3-sialyltransferase n=1 Tax=unclassified Campylobacter TaxID=2593542 RepID=UPI001DD38819|nr:alpha-2,3-sialyltransferase [Campylobacter sp. RM12651]MBZ7984101.1 hypothetical protein [Campylobacter sp. RM12647]MBZ7993399.1 hypothetical protein [Campylobacter sp. RM9333]ULO02566.1 alpha-2,3-sialyltransferase [Campylobacter sp. RM12651]